MRVKRYVADTLQEAIARVKADLGRNAIILHTKQFKEGGFMGLGAQRRFEVIAAIDESPAPVIAQAEPVAVPKPEKSLQLPPQLQPQLVGAAVAVAEMPPLPRQSLPTPVARPVAVAAPVNREEPVMVTAPAVNQTETPPLPTPAPPVPPVDRIEAVPLIAHTSPTSPVLSPVPVVVRAERPISAPEPALESFRAELAEMKAMIRQAALKSVAAPVRRIGDESPALAQVREKLNELGLAPGVIGDLVAEIPLELQGANPELSRLLTYCQQLLAAKLMFSDPLDIGRGGKQQIFALIGPTGVGKTTTIAKLAANFNLFERKKVGLVTIDTYRIAAVEHLKTYGDIMNLPVEVVYTPADLEQAIANLKRCDIILVDTAGRSPRNQAMMDELGRFIAKPFIETILLVISATTQYQDMVNIEQKFSRIAYTHLVFTKLDETSSMGSVVSLAWNCRRPISYLTAGQNVPDDIEVAKPEPLIAQLFKGLSHG